MNKGWMDFPKLRCVEGIKIRIQPLCNEYIFWVPYLSFAEKDYASFLCMILDWMWLREFSWGKNVFATLEMESMEIFCILIFAMENGWKYIILYLFCSTWKMLNSQGR